MHFEKLDDGSWVQKGGGQGTFMRIEPRRRLRSLGWRLEVFRRVLEMQKWYKVWRLRLSSLLNMRRPFPYPNFPRRHFLQLKPILGCHIPSFLSTLRHLLHLLLITSIGMDCMQRLDGSLGTQLEKLSKMSDHHFSSLGLHIDHFQDDISIRFKRQPEVQGSLITSRANLISSRLPGGHAGWAPGDDGLSTHLFSITSALSHIFPPLFWCCQRRRYM